MRLIDNEEFEDGRRVACQTHRTFSPWEVVMRRKKWLWGALLSLPLAIGGLVYAGVQANVDSRANEAGFVCPITGEELSCPKCCPLN